MTTNERNWFHSVATWASDFTKLGVFLSMVFAVVWFAARPAVEPYLSVPQTQQLILSEQQSLKNLIDEVARPLILEFQGEGVILSAQRVYSPGDTVPIMYFLRRNATCQTRLELDFLEVDRNIIHNSGQTIARQAPVTSNFIPFPIDIVIPDNMPDGRYVYWPKANAIDCGRYSNHAVRVTPSEIFEVRREE